MLSSLTDDNDLNVSPSHLTSQSGLKARLELVSSPLPSFPFRCSSLNFLSGPALPKPTTRLKRDARPRRATSVPVGQSKDVISRSLRARATLVPSLAGAPTQTGTQVSAGRRWVTSARADLKA